MPWRHDTKRRWAGDGTARRVVLLLACGVLLAACGPEAVSDIGDTGANTVPGAQETPATSRSAPDGAHPLSDHPFNDKGGLVGAAPAEVADLQAHVVAQLADGLPPSAFTPDLPDPDGALMRMGGASGAQPGWEMVGERRRMYLVGDHLHPVSNVVAREGFCASGTLYEGHAAARPWTRREFQATALQVTVATAYGLQVCETGDDVELRLVNAKTQPGVKETDARLEMK